MDLNCPFCQAPLAPGAAACQGCGCVVAAGGAAGDKPTTDVTEKKPESKRLPPAGNEHSRELREKLTAGEAQARDKALGALGHLVRPGRVKWPWPEAGRDTVAGKPPAAPRPDGRRRLAAALQRAPSWAVSGVLHLVVIIVMALITVGANEVRERLVLIRGPVPKPPVQPLPELPEAGNTDLFKDLAELDPTPSIPSDLIDKLAETADGTTAPSVRQAEKPTVAPMAAKYGWRGHGGRRYAAAKGGGTWGSEQAVDRGLRWLADNQTQEGWWGYHEEIYQNGRPMPRERVGLTGLALLAFLGAGNTPDSGKYSGTVRRGIAWLVEQQGDRGGLGKDESRPLYHHSIATLALCEAVGMGATRYRSPARSAASYLLWAQNADGGWRYFPRGSKSDTSVTGWGVMALSAARAAQVRNVDKAMARARAYLDAVTTPEGEVGYLQPAGGIPAMTAVGLLCKHLTGALAEDPLQRKAAQLVVEPMPRWEAGRIKKGGGRIPAPVFRQNNPVNFYRWYYTSIALIHRNDENWRRWNPATRDLLVGRQRIDDAEVNGSWDPMGLWCAGAGRVYSTAMSVLTLEVYYRAAPAFLEVPEDPLAGLDPLTPFYGQALIERAMDAAAEARRAYEREPSRAHAASAAAQGALERFRAWASKHLSTPAPQARGEVQGWLRLAEREEGEIALLRGDEQRALTLLVPALTRDPDGPGAPRVRRLVIQTLIRAAKKQRIDGDEAGATARETKAARLIGDLLDRNEEPDAARARTLRVLVGDLQARADQPTAAATSYREALRGADAATAEPIRKKLAAMLLQLKDWQGALETLGVLGGGDHAAGVDPVVACNAVGALAQRIMDDGNPAGAAAIYRDALERFGRDEATKVVVPRLKRGLAEALSGAGAFGEAANVWMDLAGLGYGDAARLKAAYCMVRGGRASEAVTITADLQAALQPFSAEWWEARCVFAEALYAAGRYQDCRELVKNTKLLYPSLGGEETKGRFMAVYMKAKGKTLKPGGAKKR